MVLMSSVAGNGVGEHETTSRHVDVVRWQYQGVEFIIVGIG